MATGDVSRRILFTASSTTDGGMVDASADRVLVRVLGDTRVRSCGDIDVTQRERRDL